MLPVAIALLAFLAAISAASAANSPKARMAIHMYRLKTYGVRALLPAKKKSADSMGAESEPQYIPPGQLDHQKKVLDTIDSGNPRAMVGLATRIEKKYPKTARVLVARAIKVEKEREARRKVEIPSPIAGINNYCWGKYCRLMDKRPPSQGNGRLGVFGMSLRRLNDLGLVTRIDGDIVEWKEGIGPEDFENNLALQYAAFVKSSKDHARKIKKSGIIGQDILGKPASLSGLMAVAHFAGYPGFESWVKNDRDKDKFPATTEAYERMNGIF